MTRIAGLFLVASITATAADTRLADAAQKRNLQDVRALLAQHVDVNGAQVDGATALLWATHAVDRELDG